ncbi:lactate utilization protein [Curtanaerobium respiraculi]|uniref:lactate utilization protein n=1 Tax=Curtanaerobium respiraculi TaxID=2949669 RepID=UPI0024B324B2|nr:lactate utilization protein [Curtanaerobium respiraculi]
MHQAKKEFYRKLGTTMVKKFARRGIDAVYCETADEARRKALEMMPAGSSVTWGGSMTIEDIGLLDAVRAGDYAIIDRQDKGPGEDPRIMLSKQMMADYFLMSTNAFTEDGELVNIDGMGTRLCFLACGPAHVLVIAGMQKACRDVPSAIRRVHDLASPPNCMRLNLKTPCATTGQCADCNSPDCICCSEVITRHSRTPHRITVLMVGEDLGF